MIANETYGEEMKRLREDLGLSQKQVGRLVGVAGETISSWERGDRQGNSTEASKLPRRVIRMLKRRIQYRDKRTR